jgi:hypothetical protein
MNSNVWLETIIFLLILLVYLFNRFERRHTTPEIAYEHLRAEAFSLRPKSSGISPETHPKPYSAIMEIGFPGAIATLITSIEGTANLYFSNGSGKAGKASQTKIRDAALNFIDQTQKYISMLHPVDSFPIPQIGYVRFYVLTPGGVYSAEVSERQLQNSESCLTFLYQYGYDVITLLGKNSS